MTNKFRCCILWLQRYLLSMPLHTCSWMYFNADGSETASKQFIRQDGTITRIYRRRKCIYVDICICITKHVVMNMNKSGYFMYFESLNLLKFWKIDNRLEFNGFSIFRRFKVIRRCKYVSTLKHVRLCPFDYCRKKKSSIPYNLCFSDNLFNFTNLFIIIYFEGT